MKEGLLDDKYRIIRKLGNGGMSSVYLAENIRLGNLWAIKEISKHKGAETDLLVEPNILKKLNHPALPRIFDIFEDQDNIYIVEDYIQGTPLDLELARVGRFSEAIVLQWAIQICEVLEYLHGLKPNPIIYRDMKPANIILTPDGKLKLIDFGIAREYKRDAGQDTTYIGTRGYAAPEQYGYGQSTVVTDIYSLGITMLHLLTGISPIQAMIEFKQPGNCKKALSEDMEKIISRCTRHDPSQRYQSASELKAALGNILGKNSEPGTAGKGSEINNESGLLTSGAVAFRKQILTVHDNLEFASELAYATAKLASREILLINLDCLSAPVDCYLSLERPAYMPGADLGWQAIHEDASGYEEPQQFLLTYGRRSKDYKNLQVLSNCFEASRRSPQWDEYPDKLLDYTYRRFDLILVNIPGGWDNAYSINAIRKCDSVILPFVATLDEIKRCNSWIAYFHRYFNLDLHKVCCAAIEYKKGIHLATGDIIQHLGKTCFLGCIEYSSRREAYRSLKAVYCRRMDACMLNQYSGLLAWFGVTPPVSLKQRIELWVLRIQTAFKGRRKNRKQGK